MTKDLIDYLDKIRKNEVTPSSILDYCNDHNLMWVEDTDGWWIDDDFISYEWLDGNNDVYVNGELKES